MTDITIPPEALKAAARAAYDKATGNTPDAQDDWDDPALDVEKHELFEVVRAACLAMLRAWPHAFNEDARLLGAGAGPCLILPLPQENTNAEG